MSEHDIVSAFSKTLAREASRDGVSVNAVRPGSTRTEQVDRLSTDDSRPADSLVRSVPMRPMGTVDEVAAAITFLGSPSARYVTGQTLSVSGGLTMV
jgi:2-hydroxycyclohexanecarboxyl-CoA dehydrogenase